jgi:hypothetical protein
LRRRLARSCSQEVGFSLLGRKAAERETQTRRFIPAFAKNILLLHIGINALLFRFAWCTTQGHRAMPSYIANRKGETLMKTALVRILTLATLATSLSAFAAADDPKTDNAANASTTQQQAGCADYAHKEKKQKKAKSQRDDQRTEQEKEFDRVLMGYYGG